ncbi:MAG: sulfate ABC transporter ATP-binding protein [Candidatus Hydrogenedentes bacterium]|nr:sulfate ABC transporter ATP-binding protein [Candidatus Hydrogenedentota bacterium]
MAVIELRNIFKKFGDFVALDDVSFSVDKGELVALLGPSGSGKTTLLRVIAGLERPDSGAVFLEGRDVTEEDPRDRGIGFVFQHYALFKHMTVFENVAFGLRVKPRKVRPSESEIREKVMKLLHLVQLDFLADRYPSQLSGGQRQRVALARALAIEPYILLLDEPFGSLDARVRKELRRWLRRLHDEIQVTSVFVTHDQEEALELADRVVITNQGRVEQIGSPEEVYFNPATPFVFQFLGDVNLFHGRELSSGEIVFIQNETAGIEKKFYVRPNQVSLSLVQSLEHPLQCKVNYINPAGPMVKVEVVDIRGNHILALLTQDDYNRLGLKKNTTVYVGIKEHKVFE